MYVSEVGAGGFEAWGRMDEGGSADDRKVDGAGGMGPLSFHSTECGPMVTNAVPYETILRIVPYQEDGLFERQLATPYSQIPQNVPQFSH